MAVRTSIGSGPWSAAGTWNTGVPVNGDSAVIAAGHIVTFDADQSGWATGLAGLTITGTLVCSTSAGSYYLKCAADISGAGLLQAGSAETALPAAVTFTIDFAGAAKGIQLSGDLALQLYCAEPANKIIRLSGAEAAGQTELSVDTDVTGDIWKAGDTIRIDDVNQSLDSEARTIAAGGIAAGTITVTAGLANAKIVSALVILISRNIKIKGSTDYCVKNGSGARIGCEISGNTNGVYYGSAHTISGTISGNTYGVCYGSGHTISGTISGNTNGVNSGWGHTISGTISGNTNGVNSGWGHTIGGTISGNANGVYYGSGHTISGTISGNANGVYYGSGHTISGAIFNNANDLRYIPTAECFNVAFGGATENYGYNTDYIPAWGYVSSQEHDQVANAFKAWSRGGIVTSQTSSPPVGYSIYYRHACESGSFPCFRQVEVTVAPNHTLSATGRIRIESGKDHSAWPPRIQIIDKFSDPLVDSGNAALAEAQAAAAVGDGTTWQDVAVTWSNTGGADRKVLLRASAMHAASWVDEAWIFVSTPILGVHPVGTATPLIETIAVEIAAQISEITVANGYNQDLVPVRSKRNDFSDIAPVDGKVLIWQGEERAPGAEAVGTEEWLQEFLLIAIVTDGDAAATSIDTRLNQVRADIQKKLLLDHTRGGNAIDTMFEGSAKFDDGKGFSGIVVNCVVHYRTLYTTPYTKA